MMSWLSPGPHQPRPIFATSQLAMFGFLGVFLALSDTLNTSEFGWEGAVYRAFFVVGACVMFGSAWNVWRRRSQSWHWFAVAFGICVVTWLVFKRIEVLEKRLSEIDETIAMEHQKR